MQKPHKVNATDKGLLYSGLSVKNKQLTFKTLYAKHHEELREYVLSGDRLVRGKMEYACDVAGEKCYGHIRENVQRYVCWSCDDDQTSYDICEDCLHLHPKDHHITKAKCMSFPVLIFLFQTPLYFLRTTAHLPRKK